MSEKVKVTLEMPGGVKKELTGDTVICFTVEQAKEFISGRAKTIQAQTVSMGQEIPKLIFAPTIGALVRNYLETSPNSGGKAAVSYNLHTVAKLLEKNSEELKKQVTLREVKDSLQEAFKSLFEVLRMRR